MGRRSKFRRWAVPSNGATEIELARLVRGGHLPSEASYFLLHLFKGFIESLNALLSFKNLRARIEQYVR